MGWFQRLCRNAGLAIHHIGTGISEKPQPQQEPEQKTSDLHPGEQVQRVRRVTIEEVEIRSRPDQPRDDDDGKNRDDPPLIP